MKKKPEKQGAKKKLSKKDLKNLRGGMDDCQKSEPPREDEMGKSWMEYKCPTALE